MNTALRSIPQTNVLSTLTKRQTKLLNFMRKYIKVKRSPVPRDVIDHVFKYESTSQLHTDISRLSREKMIRSTRFDSRLYYTLLI